MSDLVLTKEALDRKCWNLFTAHFSGITGLLGSDINDLCFQLDDLKNLFMTQTMRRVPVT
jgi:hypothetical protein